MKLSCFGEQDVADFLQILRQYSFDKIKVELPNSALLRNKKADLLKTLEDNQISFDCREQNDDDSDNSDEEQEMDTSFSIQKKVPPKDSITKEITNPYIVLFLRSNEQRENLTKYANKHAISLVMEDTQIILSGLPKAVEGLMANVSELEYEESVDMTNDAALCLYKLYNIKKVFKENNTRKRTMYKKNNICSIIVYGKDKETVKKSIKVINQASTSIITLLELSSKYEQADEIEKINQYLEALVKTKYGKALKEKNIVFEFGKVENKSYHKHLFFLYIKSKESVFNSIKTYMASEMASFCILNILPKRQNEEVPLVSTGICEDKINIIQLSDKSHLLLGKSKHLQDKIKGLFKQENIASSVYEYKLRFKRICKQEPPYEEIKIELFAEKGLQVELLNDRNLYIFVVRSSWEDVKKILISLERILKGQRGEDNQSMLTQTQDFINLLVVDRETKSAPQVEAQEKNKLVLKPIIEENSQKIDKEASKTLRFDLDNLNEQIFDLKDVKAGELQAVPKESDDFSRLSKLFKKDYPNANVNDIVKCHILKPWKSYCNSKAKYPKNKFKEYTMFLKSSEDPVVLLHDYVHNSQGNFVSSICPKDKEVFFRDPEEISSICVCACVVLVEEDNQDKIIDSYPAYFIQFEEK